jgi:5,5'-dehydrodivanillate O-demethylase
MYHGWAYDATGQCVDQPAEPTPFCHKVRIASYPTREYLGLIFGYLGEGDPPPLPRFPYFEDQEDCIIDNNIAYIWPCNYFNCIENDPAHIPFTHRGTSAIEAIPYVQSEETEYGIIDHLTRVDGTVGNAHRLLPNGKYVTGFPSRDGWREHVIYFVPVTDDSTGIFGITQTHLNPEAAQRRKANADTAPPAQRNDAETQDLAEAVLRGDLTISELLGRPDIVHLQDYVAQVGQGTILDREHDRLGRSDEGVILLRKLWQREMRALAEGRPIKRYTVPDRLTVAPDWLLLRTADR